jgi:lipid-A-disaccharide synthase
MDIGIVAGEASGDALGAGLIAALRRARPDAAFVGIGGTGMQAAGAVSWFPMERLSVMGLDGLAGRLRDILRIRRALIERMRAARPAVYVGVDVPDFNLGVEAALRAHGIPTVHYVSPMLWAWRGWRVRRLRAAADRVLVLFPFEEDYLRRRGVHATFVGHPLGDELDRMPGRDEVRARLGLHSGQRAVAVLPGSRAGEVRRLAPVFLEACGMLAARYPGLEFLVPVAGESVRGDLEAAIAAAGGRAPALRLFSGRAREVLAAADVGMLASGTATLEAALLGLPSVLAYRVSPLTAAIGRLLVQVKHVGLPNLLAGEELMPERLLGRANAGEIASVLAGYLDDDALRSAAAGRLRALRPLLGRNAGDAAARAVLELAAARSA